MSASPTLEEVECALVKLNNGKSPGMDGLGAKIFNCGGPAFMKHFVHLLAKVWRDEYVPQEYKDAKDD